MGAFADRLRDFDRFQQRHPALGFPLAVLQKYSDDQAAYLAYGIGYTTLASQTLGPASADGRRFARLTARYRRSLEGPEAHRR